MPKYSIDTVIQKAIYPATQDRLAMLDADPARAKETLGEIIEIKMLAALQFSEMTDAQKQNAFMALVYAEQWESSLADSLGRKSKYGRRSIQLSIMFSNYRHKHFGKSAFEHSLDSMEPYRLCSDGKFRNKDGKLMPIRAMR